MSDTELAPVHPALQAPTMPLDRLAVMCFESANDRDLRKEIRAMNWRLWVFCGHLRVAVARQGMFAAQLKASGAPGADSSVAQNVAQLEAQFNGFLKLFEADIQQRMQAAQQPTQAPAAQDLPPAAVAPASKAPPTPMSPDEKAKTDEFIEQATIQKEADLAEARTVAAKSRGKRS